MEDLLDSIERQKEGAYYARFDAGSLACSCGSGLHIRDCECPSAAICRELRAEKAVLQTAVMDEREKEERMFELDKEIHHYEGLLT
jgi:hypothetical protein